MEAEVMELEIDKIIIGSNRRDLDMNFVEELAQSIQEFGLMHPIIVNMEYTLIAGLHRLEAVKLLGWGKIQCTVMDLRGLQAELAEIDENFIRNPLSEREKCKILSRRKKIYEEIHPETKYGGDRKSEKIKSARCGLDFVPAKSFAQDAAEKLGISPSSVERRVRIADRVTPEAMAAFDNADEKFSQREALKLTHIPPEHQEEAARQYVSGKIRTISDYKADEPDTADCGKAEQAEVKTERQTMSPAARENRKQESAPSALKMDSQPGVALPPVKPSHLESKASIAASYKDPVIGEIVADLKDAEKERPCTVGVFMSEFDAFIERLINNVGWFETDEYVDVFPTLTEAQYQALCDRKADVNARMDTFLKFVRRKMKK